VFETSYTPTETAKELQSSARVYQILQGEEPVRDTSLDYEDCSSVECNNPGGWRVGREITCPSCKDEAINSARQVEPSDAKSILQDIQDLAQKLEKENIERNEDDRLSFVNNDLIFLVNPGGGKGSDWEETNLHELNPTNGCRLEYSDDYKNGEWTCTMPFPVGHVYFFQSLYIPHVSATLHQGGWHSCRKTSLEERFLIVSKTPPNPPRPRGAAHGTTCAGVCFEAILE